MAQTASAEIHQEFAIILPSRGNASTPARGLSITVRLSVVRSKVALAIDLRPPSSEAEDQALSTFVAGRTDPVRKCGGCAKTTPRPPLPVAELLQELPRMGHRHLR